MRKAFLIASVLVFLGTALKAQDNTYPRFTYGAEWGYTGIFYYGYHYNFYAPEGFRVDPRGHSFTYESNEKRTCMQDTTSATNTTFLYMQEYLR